MKLKFIYKNFAEVGGSFKGVIEGSFKGKY